ncbi:MAG: hypothetical protein AAGD00_06635 [Planctomycetota bacterium]
MSVRTKFHNIAVSTLGTLSNVVHPRPATVYANAAQQDATQRNPLIIIPGIMGTKLRDKQTGLTLWGGCSRKEYADPNSPEQMRAISIPMGDDCPIDRIDDAMEPAGAIDRFRGSMIGLPLHVRAYESLLEALGVGGFLAAERPGLRRRKKLPDYGLHSVSTCFQFDYDWRATIPQNAKRFAEFVERVADFASRDHGEHARCAKEDIKVDVVAHSMGGLLLRWFLRYGGRNLQDARALDAPTWDGCKRVEHAILVATPNAGAIGSLQRLLAGLNASPATPGYAPQVIGTMPSLYHLLPRSRHGLVIDRTTGDPIEDLFDVKTWERMGWGLVDPRGNAVRAALLPDLSTDSDRLRTARAHLDACLRAAHEFQQLLDAPFDAPLDTSMHLFAGDGMLTPASISVAPNDPNVRVESHAQGDGTVLRASALLDERLGSAAASPRVVTPIRWDAVTFIPTNHMGVTRHPTFINNVLYTLLEKPRPTCEYRTRLRSTPPNTATPAAAASSG